MKYEITTKQQALNVIGICRDANRDPVFGLAMDGLADFIRKVVPVDVTTMTPEERDAEIMRLLKIAEVPEAGE
jgi:hypothetical protein